MGDKVVTPVIYGYMAVRMGRKCPFFYAFFGLGHILDVLTKVRSI